MNPSLHPTLRLLLPLLLFWSAAADAGEVKVAVAANFTDAAREIAGRFERWSGHTAKVSYGSSGKLYAQIEHGAPFEVLLAADAERPAKAEAEGLAVPGSRFTYAEGRLVLWSAAADRFEDGGAYLNGGAFRRAAIANPKTAPYGAAARQVLERLGLWGRLSDRLVRGDSIAQAFQFTATGNAEAGLVALSQVKGWRGEPGSLWVIPASYYDPIAQQAVLLKRGEENPAARAFLAFLRGAEARAVIAGYGYGVPMK